MQEKTYWAYGVSWKGYSSEVLPDGISLEQVDAWCCVRRNVSDQLQPDYCFLKLAISGFLYSLLLGNKIGCGCGIERSFPKVIVDGDVS